MNYEAFNFITPKKIIYGWGKLLELGKETKKLGKKALLVSGKRISPRGQLFLQIQELLAKEAVETILFNQLEGEPELKIIQEGITLLKSQECDLVIGIGGGSSIDSAKAIAGLAYLEGTVEDYFFGKDISKQGLPWIAIPTTAGTGAEATKNAVLGYKEKKMKQSIRSDYWMTDLALVDPQLTVSMSPQITAYTGMDAFTQAIESYTSRGATVLTDSISLEAARLIGENILTAYWEGNNRIAREAMALGSLMAGITLTNARLGLVHGLAHPLGARYDIPHGLVCAVLLPYAIEFNFSASSAKYDKIASVIKTENLLDFVQRINREMGIPEKLSSLGLRKEDITIIVEESLPSGSLKANFKNVGYDDLMQILLKNL